MPGRGADLFTVIALATIVTIVVAAPVLRAPSARVFGAELVGRHHDPFTAMQQFARPLHAGVYWQPITDVSGAMIARLADPVAAYNWLVLLSFPLAALAAYLLARHLMLSHAGAMVAAMAFAFSPFHFAHAAYHPHIAQVQWLPLYLLALWRCLDAGSLGAIAVLCASAAAVVLSNFYGGLIAMVITPVAVGSYWTITRRSNARPIRRLGVTIGGLGIIATAGMTYAWWAARVVVTDPASFAVSQRDLSRYGATWWSYLLPPVAHPLLGPEARRVWTQAGVQDGLLEQQLSIGWGIIALALLTIAWWVRRDRRAAPLAYVPVMVIVGSVAFACSLAPEQRIGAFTFAAPGAMFHDALPMFRSYARFGVIVQLMTVLLSGIAVDGLLRSGARARLVAIALLALAVAEYAVAPSGLSRDTLPTGAHRWVIAQTGDVRVIDCVPRDQESSSLAWLTNSRITVLSEPITDCAEPNFAQKLAAHGFTHVLVRRHTAPGPPAAAAPSGGLQLVASFPDGLVFAVAAPRPTLYTSTMTGFSAREHDAHWSWRWMGPAGAWIIDNTSVRAVAATLDVEVSAFHRDRRVTLLLNNRPLETIVVEPERRTYHIGPIRVPPGAHQLAFQPVEPATAPDAVLLHSGDRRLLSVAIGAWAWTVESDGR